ncbi:MAG: NAD-dependent protein deacetylase [Betaproteobacteria bacterium ADurb.Bin341]|nr:MAG: NAD-dependent protein deacetylase [Betaproteobacteria bacterium ADurb.Bin341]
MELHAIEQILDAVANHLTSARRILFITGAGISADSGLPTYRGIGGLYEGNLTEDGYRIEDALSGEMLRHHPAITWKYLAQIEANCRGAGPNAAHAAIARLEEEFASVLVFTQNIDGLHQAAGSRNVIEIHGDMHRLLCTACGQQEHVESLEGREIPPLCPQCQSFMRPEVVLFGEALPQQALERFYDEMEEGFDLVFSVGTTSVFPYIAQPVVWAARAGIPTVEINPGETMISEYVAYKLPLGAAKALQSLLERL